MSSTGQKTRAEFTAYRLGVRIQQFIAFYYFGMHLRYTPRSPRETRSGVKCDADIVTFHLWLGRAFAEMAMAVAPQDWRHRTLDVPRTIEKETDWWWEEFRSHRERFADFDPKAFIDRDSPLLALACDLAAPSTQLQSWIRLGRMVAQVLDLSFRDQAPSGPRWDWPSPEGLERMAREVEVPFALLFPAEATDRTLDRHIRELPRPFWGWHHVEAGLIGLRGLCNARASEARHSPDFRSVNWFGRRYSFTPIQTACVKELWEVWKNATPEVGQAYVLEKAEADSARLSDVFKNHPAWGKMIVPGSVRGTFRLQPPVDE
jgi:hypothetical protein